MMITDSSKRVIPFRDTTPSAWGRAASTSTVVWLNGDRIELGDRVGSTRLLRERLRRPRDRGRRRVRALLDGPHGEPRHGGRGPPGDRAGLAGGGPGRVGATAGSVWARYPPGRQIGEGSSSGPAASWCTTCGRSPSRSGTREARSGVGEQADASPLPAQQPCGRARKFAVGLDGRVELGFAYQGRSSPSSTGRGRAFEAWYPRRRPGGGAPGGARGLRSGPRALPQPPGRADRPRAGLRGRAGGPRRPRPPEPPANAVRGRLPRAEGPAGSNGGRSRSAGLITVSEELVEEITARYRLPGDRRPCQLRARATTGRPRCRGRGPSPGRRGWSTRGRSRRTAATTTCATFRRVVATCRSTSIRRARSPIPRDAGDPGPRPAAAGRALHGCRYDFGWAGFDSD